MPNRDEVEVDVVRIIISEVNDQQAIFLREVGGSRSFPIVIGIFEATAISRMCGGDVSPRPLTHDAWYATIQQMKGTVVSASLTTLRDQTYFAEIRIESAGNRTAIDVRPSDAIALAVKSGAPLYINRTVFEDVAT